MPRSGQSPSTAAGHDFRPRTDPDAVRPASTPARSLVSGPSVSSSPGAHEVRPPPACYPLPEVVFLFAYIPRSFLYVSHIYPDCASAATSELYFCRILPKTSYRLACNVETTITYAIRVAVFQRRRPRVPC